ncbi:MAG: LacI family transcriptional regulator, partial [Bradyrhizobium sp.]
MLKRLGGKPKGDAHKPTRRKATMKDVADLAGVSLATVSRALSSSADVSPRLSHRVQAAARRLDYAVNINARGLR